MSNLTCSSAIDTFMQSANQADMQEAIGYGGAFTIVTTDPSGSGTEGTFQFNSENGKIWGVVSGTWTLLMQTATSVDDQFAYFMCPDGTTRKASLSV